MPQSNPLAAKQVRRGWLGFGSFGVLVLLVWLLMMLWDVREQRVELARDEQSSEQLVRQILLLDEALSMSAQLFVETGELHWGERYAASSADLRAALDGMLEDSIPELRGPLKNSTALASSRRLELESTSITLAEGGDREQAMALLAGREYAQWKESYREGLLSHRAGMSYHFNGRQERAAKGEQVLIALALASLAAILSMGFYVAKLIRNGMDLREALDDETAEHRDLLAALDCLADGMLIIDRQATITYVNDAYCKFSGYSKDVLTGASMEILNSEETLEEVYVELVTTLSGGESWAGRIYNKRRLGPDQYEGHWTYLHLSPLIHGSSDRLYGFVGTQRDITLEVKAEEEANLRHEFASSLARVCAKLDGVGNVVETLASALAELTSGTGFREDLGAAILRMGAGAEDMPLVLASCGGFERFDATNSIDFDQPLTQSEVRSCQVFIGLSDDLLPAEELAGYIIVPFGEEGDSRGALVVGCEGRVAGDLMFAEMLESMAGLFGSRTLRAQVREALEESVESATRANRFKTRFLAKMSQEIRTPMTSIVGYSDLLLDGERSPDDHEHAAGMIREGARELLELVDGIIDISNMESGVLELDCTETSPLEVISRVIQGLVPQAAAKGIRLELDVEGKVPALVHTDPRRLRQVFFNLIGNAVKFTEVGKVTVRARVIESGDEGLLQVDVMDTGTGILDDQRGKLFQAFQHGDARSTRHNSGAGLGLAISRGLVRLLGGDLFLGDSEHTGSTFTVKLPLGPLKALDLAYWQDLQGGSVSEANQAESTIALPYRLLLAEDNKVNQRVISRLLERAGAQVEIAATGLEAIQFVDEAAERDQLFDAVLMDLMMPELDGLSATRQLREAGHRLPIIALTADARIRTSLRCREAGCDGFATKPVDREELFSLLSSLVAGQSDRTTSA